MKRQADRLGRFGIIGAVVSFLIGYPVSSAICSTFQIESYALIAVLYFAITTAFAFPLMKIGQKLDDKKERQRMHEEDKDEE